MLDHSCLPSSPSIPKSFFFQVLHITCCDLEDELSNDDDYNPKEHKQIKCQRHISEFGKRLTQADIQLENDKQCRQWMGLDHPPSLTNFWRTVVAVGIPSFSHVLLAQNFRLKNPRLLQNILEKHVYAVEKSFVQIAGFFGLDRNPHTVLGQHASAEFCKTFGWRLNLLNNLADHQYDPKNPYKPTVCNTRSILWVSTIHA
jgi:hypothetical protein